MVSQLHHFFQPGKVIPIGVFAPSFLGLWLGCWWLEWLFGRAAGSFLVGTGTCWPLGGDGDGGSIILPINDPIDGIQLHGMLLVFGNDWGKVLWVYLCLGRSSRLLRPCLSWLSHWPWGARLARLAGRRRWRRSPRPISTWWWMSSWGRWPISRERQVMCMMLGLSMRVMMEGVGKVVLLRSR